MPYVIAAACIDVMDRSCMDECPVDCIFEGDRKLYVNPFECIDCGPGGAAGLGPVGIDTDLVASYQCDR